MSYPLPRTQKNRVPIRTLQKKSEQRHIILKKSSTKCTHHKMALLKFYSKTSVFYRACPSQNALSPYDCWDLRLAFVCHVNCNFELCYTCQITVIFGTRINGSLLINILASNNRFSYRNIFQKWRHALSKTVDAFLSKSSKFCIVHIIRYCSNFAGLWRKHLIRNYWNY